MITSIDAEKVFDKIKNSLMIKKKKKLQKVGIEETYLNITKAIYEKPIANIILSGEKQSIPLKIRNKTRMSILTTIIQHSFRRSSQGNQRKKEIKGMQITKKEVKLSVVADDTIPYIDNTKDATRKLLKLISESR